MRRLLPYMKKYRIYAILCPLFMVLEVFADVFIPYLMSRIVDIGIANQDINFVVRTGVIMILAALVAMLLGILSAHYGARAGFGFAAEIRQATFEKIQGFSFANLDGFTVSSLITRLTNDCNTIGQVTMMSLRTAIRFPFLMLFAFIMAFRINPSLATVLVVSMPAAAIFIVAILRKARPLFLQMQKRVDRVNAVIKENLAAIRVVKSFNRQSYEEQKFKERNDSLRDLALRAISLVIFIMPVLNVVIYATIIAVLWFGGQQVVGGVMGKGELISFVTYITQIMMALMMISVFFMQLLRGMASMDRIFEVWDTDSEIQETDQPLQEIKDGSIQFKNVSFCYPGSGEKTLKNVNFEIASGEFIGIIGSTGSSKSTLVQLIPRLYDVIDGKVLVSGIDVRDYSIESLRNQIAFVLQENSLFSGTIRENMLWGNEAASDGEIVQALQQSQAWEFVSNYDDGLDHRVEQGGSNFSGGQKQRLCIARALLKQPKVIILDDSTSAVDMTTDAKIQHVFKEALRNLTKIIIAQRIASIKHADRILVLHEGQIESIGTHEQLLESSPIYREIYESQERGVLSE